MTVPGVDCRGLTRVFTLRGRLLGRRHGTVTALDGVDLTVEHGAIHGVIGPNGSGKSTLLRVLATLVLPTAGGAAVAGIDVVADPVAARRRVGFSTGEERSLYWRLTARQNLEFFAALHGVRSPDARIAEVLDQFELAADADRPVSGFSQGMLRRLGLARAMLHRPEVLLLDEPSRSLDVAGTEHLHALLRRRRDEDGATVVITTHDLAEAADICDTVSVLRHGRIVETSAPADVASLRTAVLGAQP
jgi:ABC-2 type transport system ATP-binding protein